MAFVSGLDLGQRQDPSTLAVLEQKPLDRPVGRRRWRYECRHLEEWPLGTRYTQVAEDVRQRFDTPQLRWSKLAPDYTGVGAAVVEQLRAARVTARLRPVLITSGSAVTLHEETRSYHVPKVDLVATLQVLLQVELVTVDRRLKLADKLRQQLGQFRVSVTRAKNETFGAESGSHDDLVLAVALAAWLGEREGGGDAAGVSGPAVGSGCEVERAPAGVFLAGPQGG